MSNREVITNRQLAQIRERGYALIGIVAELQFALSRLKKLQLPKEARKIIAGSECYRNIDHSESALRDLMARDARKLRIEYERGGADVQKYTDHVHGYFDRVFGIKKP